MITWEQNVKNVPNLYNSFTFYLAFLFQQKDNTVIKTNVFTIHNPWAIIKVCLIGEKRAYVDLKTSSSCLTELSEEIN